MRKKALNILSIYVDVNNTPEDCDKYLLTKVPEAVFSWFLASRERQNSKKMVYTTNMGKCRLLNF